MGRDTVKLKDIAAATGFSTNTVSLALRESPRIPESTREVIKKAASKLNYTPNQIAKSLVSRKSMTVGLVVTDILNPILTRVAQGVTDSLGELGYTTLFATSNNTQARENEIISMFRGRQVDGILIYPSEHQNTDHVSQLRDSGFPIVSMVADPKNQIDAVCVNDFEGARKLGAHLIELGHTDIACLDASSFLGNTEKLDGLKAATLAAGIKFDDNFHIEIRTNGIEAGYQAAKNLWESGKRPSAIMCTNDSLAFGVQRFCEDHNLSIPGDIALAGFDNIEFARLATVPITTIDYPVDLITKQAVEHLIALIDGTGPLPQPIRTQFDPDLIVRQSTRG